MRTLFLCSCLALVAPVFPSQAIAQSAAPAPTPAKADDDDNGDKSNAAIVVTARRLDAARDSIQTSIGASQYHLSRADLDVQPGGADRSLKGVLLQAPGVAQDSDGDGDIHIRNEHANIQYRLNGITVPESFTGFGALVDPRVAESIEVITGALPAQYGLRTAGIVALKTRTDSFDFDGDVGVYGGSNGAFQPSATIRDSVGPLNIFASGSYLRSNLGISNPTPSRTAIHDRTEQERGFGYLSYLTGDNSRITAFGGSSVGRFQIPNSPGVASQYTLNGQSTFDSTKLDQNQRQQTHFGVLAFQHSAGNFDFQIAPFVRYAKAHFTPDPKGGELIFNGADTDLSQSSLAYGAQADASLKLGSSHTVRGGLFFQRDRTRTVSINRVFAVDAQGNQTSDVPIVIPINQRLTGTTVSAYIQDEWQIGDRLTLNYGLRYDHVVGLVSEGQLSPRAGLVWKPGSGTTIHLGYARYFTPPPLELTGNALGTAFNGTTGEVGTLATDPIRAEREHSFDIGAQQKFGYLTLGIDVYYKFARNLLDEQQFGSTLIQSPYNYAKARNWGVELSANYEHGPVEAYVNVARGQQRATQIVSNQFLFDPAELAYIANHYIYTDHSQKLTISAGGSLKLNNGLGQFQPSFDLVHGDGLRAGDPAGIVPNGGKQRPYTQVNLGLAQRFGSNAENAFTVRFDVINLFDQIYLLRDGSGVGAGQNQYGPRRAFMLGVRKSF